MAATKGLLDLEGHFAFYGAYHRNPVNVLIHVLFVWPIAFASLMLMHSARPLFPLPADLDSALGHGVLVLNVGFVLTLLYGAFYILLDRKAGCLAALVCFACWIGASLVAHALGSSLAWKVGWAAQFLCWTGQFIGHGVFEKRAPALLDNLVQAFLMAPFFVILEVLQSSFGYEPYPGFSSTVKARIDADVKQWQEKKSKKVS